MKKHNYGPKYKSIFNKLAVKYGLKPSDVEEYVDDFFVEFSKLMRDPRIPRIHITNLGTFFPRKSSIDRSLRFMFRHMKRKDTEEGRESFKDNIRKKAKKLWPIRNRITEEKMGRETWVKWNQTDPDQYKALTEDLEGDLSQLPIKTRSSENTSTTS